MTFKRILTDKQERKLINEYLGTDDWTINELSIIFRVSKRTVWRILQKHNVNRRPIRSDPKNAFKKKRTRKPVVKPKRELLPCGTNAAYHRHRRAGEYPCSACLAAHAENVKLAKEKRKKRDKARTPNMVGR